MNHCHLSHLVQKQAEILGQRVALRFRDYEVGQWRGYTWQKFAQRVDAVSRALIVLGVGEQENVALFSQNKPEYLFVEFGSFGVRAVTVPFYATCSAAQVQYMLNDAEVRVLFVGEQQQYDVAMEVVSLCKKLEKIIIFDPQVQRKQGDSLSMSFADFLNLGKNATPAERAEVERRRDAAQATDRANILYTSGTTGQSKGVQILHSQYDAAIVAHEKVLNMGPEDVTLNFLPFCHVFEGAWSKLCVAQGVQQAINLRPLDVQQSLREVRPTLMCAVPRFWEKVYQGVLEKIEKASPVQQKMMRAALDTSISVWENYVSQQKPVPLALRLKHAFFDRTIIAIVRRTLGLNRTNFFPVAGATIPKEVERFVHACGWQMLAGYGLTETCATVTCDHPGQYKTPGSIGRPLPDVEVRISDEGEIQVRGAGVMPGYYKNAEATHEAFTEDGWFKTGDAGYLKNGELYITERIKDLFKTSNGKYIAPQALEGKLTIDRHFEQAVIVADGRKFVSALIVPSQLGLEKIAAILGLPETNRERLCQNQQVIAYLQAHIDTLQAEFAPYERIKRFVLLSDTFTMDNGLLTNTLKIKRREVYKRYAEAIEQMYAD